jgi:hypothetical protein
MYTLLASSAQLVTSGVKNKLFPYVKNFKNKLFPYVKNFKLASLKFTFNILTVPSWLTI